MKVLIKYCMIRSFIFRRDGYPSWHIFLNMDKNMKMILRLFHKTLAIKKIQINFSFLLILIILCCIIPFMANAKNSFVNKLGMVFVPVKSGTFVMGSPESEMGHQWNEKQHRVKISKFFISQTEVTQQQWQDLMGYNPSSYVKNCQNCPVNNVSWYDCQKFIKKLNALEHTKKYRLPTEAEWEYACRAGSSTAFANGRIKSPSCKYDKNLYKIAWYCGNSGKFSSNGNRTPQPVAVKKPNSWNIYGMHGNVQEWCLDSCDWRNILTGKVGVTTDTYRNNIRNPYNKSGNRKVIRGGSFQASSRMCRSARRYYYRPKMKLNTLGFRIIKRN